ncbi:hypothetical protein QJS04_geneDACA006536 [Acorus gramineus]|uniref:Protein misato homolog 1 n=1 Tax=Acorus gramineus TaxID=55184 RepID=A0AAV9AUA5_ACOGR|nr:hypothetical protein QJS04_geneDACA006536 [Acorus gramineus]
MREIVTVQVGGFSNFIGSHFWNFQDELIGLAEDPGGDPIYKNLAINMDVLYRAGETHQGISTYTPRLLSIDLQGSLGSLSSSGSLYNRRPSPDPSSVLTWTGKISRLVSEPHKKNIFLQSIDEEEHEKERVVENGVEKCIPPSQVEDRDRVECLESDVHFWTDFSKVHYHPRSLYELHGSWTEVQTFDNYGIGREVFAGGLQGEELNERLRFFIEECDHIQGIQFIVDDSGGFSSVAADFMENIADDYASMPVLLYAARHPGAYMDLLSRKQSISRMLHDAVSLSKLSSLCKLLMPIGLPSLTESKLSTFLHIEDTKTYHSSAVYAAALHSACLPFRMEMPGPTADSSYAAGAIDINGIVQTLAGQAHQNMVTILDVAMPAPSLIGDHGSGSFQRSVHSLTPEIAEDVEDLQSVESFSVLGAFHSGGYRASISEVEDSFYSTYQQITNPKFLHLSAAVCPLPIPLPFPSIFGNLVGQRGELLSSPIPGSKPRGSLDVSSIPMATRLRSSNAILPFIEKRLGNLRRFGICRGAAGGQLLQSWGFGKEELEDMGESLSKMVMLLNDSEMYSDSD